MARWYLILATLVSVHFAQADVNIPNQMDGVFLAQFEGDDSYDPFADYSEFEEAAQEEADINFFRNGRFFNLGLAVGYRNFTGGMGELYDSGSAFGLTMAYFFDLRFALQFGFLTADHAVEVEAITKTLKANMGITVMSFNLKYYFNTQNVTRGLAELNPYVLGGFSQFSRTFSEQGSGIPFRDTANSFDFGLGIEIPLMRNKMYFGLQGTYHLVNFSDENNEIVYDGEETGKTADGDVIHVLGIIGVNF